MTSMAISSILASQQPKAGHHKINKRCFKLQFPLGHMSNRGAKKTFPEKMDGTVSY
jgi:hypothetical protein